LLWRFSPLPSRVFLRPSSFCGDHGPYSLSFDDPCRFIVPSSLFPLAPPCHFAVPPDCPKIILLSFSYSSGRSSDIDVAFLKGFFDWPLLTLCLPLELYFHIQDPLPYYDVPDTGLVLPPRFLILLLLLFPPFSVLSRHPPSLPKLNAELRDSTVRILRPVNPH